MCPVCSSSRLIVTSCRECTLVEEVTLEEGRPVASSRRLVAVGRELLPARAECARCGHSWWASRQAPLPVAAPAPANVR